MLPLSLLIVLAGVALLLALLPEKPEHVTSEADANGNAPAGVYRPFEALDSVTVAFVSEELANARGVCYAGGDGYDATKI